VRRNGDQRHLLSQEHPSLTPLASSGPLPERSSTYSAGNALAPTTPPGPLSPPGIPGLTPSEQSLLNFESVERLAAFLDSQGWTLEEEIQLLIDTARTAPTEAIRLRALADLRKVRQDILKLAGVIGEVKATRQTQDSEGNSIQESVVASLIRKGGNLDPARTTNPSHSPTPREPVLPSSAGGLVPQDPQADDGDPESLPPAPGPDPAAIPGLARRSHR